MNRRPKIISLAAILALFAFVLPVEARTWTDKSGRTIEAEFVRLDGENVIVLHNGKEKPIPLSRLIEADQQFARTARPSANSGGSTTDDPFGAGGSSSSGETKPADSGEEEKERDRNGKYPLRDWRDRAGVKSRARFISVQGQDVVLEKNNGIRFSVPFYTLIENDQEYVEKELKKAGIAHLTPSRAPPQNNFGQGAGQPPPGGYSSLPGSAPPGGYSSPPSGAPSGGIGPPKSGMGPPGGPNGFSAPPSGPPPGYSTPPGGIGPGYAPPSTPPGAPSGGYAGSPPGYSTPPSAPGSSASPGLESPPDGYSSPPSGAPPGGFSSPPSGAPPGGFGPPGGGSSTPPMSAGPGSPPSGGYAPPGGYSNPNNMTARERHEEIQRMNPFNKPRDVFYCSNCNKHLPDHVKPGDRCPHCRIYIAYEEGSDGKKTYASSGKLVTYLIFGGGGFTALVIVIGVLVRVVISAVRD